MGIVFVFLFSYMFILFGFDILENSNVGSSLIEIIIAGTVAYFLAKYFFRKEMDMKNREINVEKQKIENDFQYYLRNAHVKTFMLVTSPKTINMIELVNLKTALHRVVESHKIFKLTDMEIREKFEACDKALQWSLKYEESIKNNMMMNHLNTITVNLSIIGRKYNFDLSIA